MSGVSARTLRYYDEIGLLKPFRVALSGYRMYGQSEVDALQQILLYRELGFPLEEIKALLTASGFDRQQAFLSHLAELHIRKGRLNALILNVSKSLTAMKGDISMNDVEKFEGFKQSLVEENERKHSAEIREKHGDKAMDDANAHVKGMTQEQYVESERLRLAIEDALKTALETGNPAGEAAQNACDLHRQWLSVFYPSYTKEYHISMGEMYATDERFKAYYDKIVSGCAAFLRDAINIYCQN